MDFISAIKSGFSNYANFSGRASRSEYWYFYLFFIILYTAAGIIDGFLQIYIIQPVETEFGSAGGTGLFAGLVNLGLLIPFLSLTWRRLHDLDKSGALFFIAFTCIGLIPLLIWHATKGTTGPNRFGPDPLGSGEALPEPPTSNDGPTLEA